MKSKQVKKEKALEKYRKMLNKKLMDMVDDFDYEDKKDHVAALIFSETLPAAKHSDYLAALLGKCILPKMCTDEILEDTLSMMTLKVMNGDQYNVQFPSDFLSFLKSDDQLEAEKVLENKIMHEVFEITAKLLMNDDDAETFLYILKTYIIPNFRNKNIDIIFSPNLYFLLTVKMLLMSSKDEILNILGEKMNTAFYLCRFDANGKAKFQQRHYYARFDRFYDNVIGQMLRQEMAIWQLGHLDALEKMTFDVTF